ncbi:MAG: LVIVD repeat-containing protein [Actinomycetota bacterium]
MRRLALILTLALVAVPTGSQVVAAGPDAPAQGVTSTLVEHVKFVPFEVYGATGARLVGHYYYVTGWRSLSIYDTSTPEDPQLVSIVPFAKEDPSDPHRFENEDVATNGKVLVFSETSASLAGGGSNHLRIYDVTDKANPVMIANVAGIAQHTMTCVADCTYLYGSSGNIIDLRDPTKPALVGNWAQKAGVSGGHDVREDAPGIVVVSSGSGQNCPGAVLDVTDPVNPVKLSCIASTQRTSEYMHSETWPNNATDRFMLVGSETNEKTRCGANATGNGATYVYDTTGWESGTYHRTDRMQGKNGYLFDGNPPVNVLGCSAHWLEAAPSFHNGGIFAQGYYEHGTRFFYVNGNGKLTPVGFFTPFGGSTSAVHWITDRVVYAVDYTRGIDVLKYNGPLPHDAAADNAVTQLVATASGSGATVTGTATFAGETSPTTFTDAVGDGPGVAQVSDAAGADLVEASLSQPQAQLPYVELRFKVTNLPLPDTTSGAIPETTSYNWYFKANNKDYAVQAKVENIASTVLADDPTSPVTRLGRSFRLRGNCAVVGVLNNCPTLAWLDGSIDVPNKTIMVRVPVGASYAPDIKPGAVLTPSASLPTLYAANSVLVTNTTVADDIDWDQYTIPKATVMLGVAPAGTDPSTVDYTIPVTLNDDGTFTGQVPSVPAGSQVFAQACFGASCGYRSVAP